MLRKIRFIGKSDAGDDNYDFNWYDNEIIGVIDNLEDPGLKLDNKPTGLDNNIDRVQTKNSMSLPPSFSKNSAVLFVHS